jgi:RNA polymerase sigma-70 factor, ECF subfamily
MAVPDPHFSNLYKELKAIAARMLSGERPNHTLQATELVHEAYLRLSTDGAIAGLDIPRFKGLAAHVMRNVLVDWARAKSRDKRGRTPERITLKETHLVTDRDVDVEALDEALDRLANLDPRQAQIVEMRFFAGMTIPEIAETLSLSEKTIDRDWEMARRWLSRELEGPTTPKRQTRL